MEYIVGLAIAVAIGLTGVGAGIITAPVLVAVFHVPVTAAVGTSLVFGAITKLALVPAYTFRRQVSWRILLSMLAFGLPGVAFGAAVIAHFGAAQYAPAISLVLGTTIVAFAVLSLARAVLRARPPQRERPLLLGLLCLPIGAEVGFSSAGSGSLASIALLSLTRLSPATVVGTDLCFGLGLSIVGGGLLLATGHVDGSILPKLLVGGVAGALIAPHVAALIPARPLRVGLLLWVIFLGGQLVLRGLAR